MRNVESRNVSAAVTRKSVPTLLGFRLLCDELAGAAS
jgi:hypothetical protein